MGCPLKIGNCHRETEKFCPTRDETGETLCTMGWTSIPTKRGEAFVVYNIKMTNSDVMGIKLSATHRKYIRLMSERGGESPFDFALIKEDLREPLRRHMADLVNMGVMEEVRMIGHDDLYNHRLTDLGRNLATQIIKEGA